MNDDPIRTPAEALEAAAQAVMDFVKTGDMRNVSRGNRWVPRVAVAAAIRALASRIPEPGEDDVERVWRSICLALGDGGPCDAPCANCERDARAALSAMRTAPAEEWKPIETAPRDKQIVCGHLEKRWVRFGHYYSNVGRWYYSGTSERSQWAQVEGDAPTHWMPLPAAPAQRWEK